MGVIVYGPPDRPGSGLDADGTRLGQWGCNRPAHPVARTDAGRARGHHRRRGCYPAGVDVGVAATGSTRTGHSPTPVAARIDGRAMKIRIIDYVANPGGGVRFAIELVKGLRTRRPTVEFELVSHGHALRTYAGIFRHARDPIQCTDLAPPRYWKTQPPTRIAGVPGTGRVKRWLGYGSQWHFDVPLAAAANCDVAWFPWIGRHRMAGNDLYVVVGSFHDTIVFQWPGLIGSSDVADERATIGYWLASRARIAVGSKSTVRMMAEQFGVRPERLSVIPLTGTHIQDTPRRSVPARWTWKPLSPVGGRCASWQSRAACSLAPPSSRSGTWTTACTTRSYPPPGPS